MGAGSLAHTQNQGRSSSIPAPYGGKLDRGFSKCEEILERLPPKIPYRPLMMMSLVYMANQLNLSEHLFEVRLAFGCVVAVLLAFIGYIYLRVLFHNDQSVIHVKGSELTFQSTFASLGMGNPGTGTGTGASGSGSGDSSSSSSALTGAGNVDGSDLTEEQLMHVKRPMTVREYDEIKTKHLLFALSIPMVMMIGIHWYFQMPVPLVLQCVMLPQQFMKSQLFRIHILGRGHVMHPALKRPWKPKPAASKGFLGTLQERLDKQMKEYDAIADDGEGKGSRAAGGGAKKDGKKSNKKKKR